MTTITTTPRMIVRTAHISFTVQPLLYRTPIPHIPRMFHIHQPHPPTNPFPPPQIISISTYPHQTCDPQPHTHPHQQPAPSPETQTRRQASPSQKHNSTDLAPSVAPPADSQTFVEPHTSAAPLRFHDTPAPADPRSCSSVGLGLGRGGRQGVVRGTLRRECGARSLRRGCSRRANGGGGESRWRFGWVSDDVCGRGS